MDQDLPQAKEDLLPKEVENGIPLQMQLMKLSINCLDILLVHLFKSMEAKIYYLIKLQLKYISLIVYYFNINIIILYSFLFYFLFCDSYNYYSKFDDYFNFISFFNREHYKIVNKESINNCFFSKQHNPQSSGLSISSKSCLI